MQNNLSQPPNRLGQQFTHVEHPTDFESSEEVEAFMNRAAAHSRYYDLEPPPGENGPWGPNSDHPRAPPGSATASTFNPWDGHPLQIPLVNPYTMQSQAPGSAYPYPPTSNANANANANANYYPPSSTESTPPNGFVPYYLDTSHLPHHQTISPYPTTMMSPHSLNNSDPNSLSDPEAEQKRLRNTAASARFRAKKKKREASLERASSERRALVNKLEGRVRELEEENKWLKDLVWEKRDAREEKDLSLRREIIGEADEGDKKKNRHGGGRNGGKVNGNGGVERGPEGERVYVQINGEGEGKKEGARNDGVGTH